MVLISKNKTPLTAAPGLSDEEITVLRSCGIHTWEEYVAYALTYSGVEFGGREMFRSKVGDAVYEGIANAKLKERPMGYVIPPASLTKMKATCCATYARDGAIDPAVGDFSEDGLPHEVRLMDQMPDIRDQGGRGTCTAFASVALCEFAEGCETPLSPQFLYWATKERDGNNHEDGASLDTVQETLFEDGVCEESLWPYESEPLLDDDGYLDAGQGPAPEEAVEDAQDHRVSCRPLSPNAVRKYRKILAAGTPVVVGLTTFRSWTTNLMTRETGRVPLPYMRQDENGRWQLLEEPSGGHAMCLVGYVDDASVAGGGYFIVRNSWGEDWASECEEGAGHALIPYRYVALFCHSAFTLLDDAFGKSDARGASAGRSPAVGAAASALEKVPQNLRPFARVLDRDTRDFMGRLLPKGTCVLSLAQSGSPVLEYSPANFGTKEYQAILVASRFPSESMWTAQLRSEYDSVLLRKQEFCAMLDENLSDRSLRFKPFPDFKFSWNVLQVMGAQRISSAKVVKDFSQGLFDALLEDAVPSEESGPVPAGWREKMGKTVSARIRKVSSLSLLPRVVYVVEVFATPFEINAKSGVCQFAVSTARLLNIVRDCAFAAMGGKMKGTFVFYSIGTGTSLDPALCGIREGECSVTVSGPADNGRWDVRRPGYLTGQSAYRDFSDRMMPVTREELVAAVKTYVDSVGRGSSYASGKATVGEIVEHLHSKDGKLGAFPAFRETAIERALLQMSGNSPGKYAVCKDASTQEVFVIPAANRVEGDREYKGRSWFTNLLLFHSIHFLGLMICSAIFIGKVELEKWLGWGQSFLASVTLAAATMFVCGLIQSHLNRIVTTVERS